ncbi:MAG: PAS domain-containing sensor histidine kinase [Candidatus Manganitrophus sp. SA1]|nr:PAS domain-containing sensor histidine kinase [Candidatus Manganitrophus morganii]
MEKSHPDELLRDKLDSYRLLVQEVRDYAIFLLDLQGNVNSWNEGAERIKGYRADEIIGKPLSLFYPKQEIENGKPFKNLAAALRDGRFEDEGWRIRKDGSRFWANVIITRIQDDRGKVIGFSKITRDLTEKKEAEDAIRRSEARFRLLVNGVKDYAIFMLDPEGNITSWNEGAERIKGYRVEEIIGKHFSIFYPEEDKANDKPNDELKKALQHGRFEDEGWRIRKDGSRFWADAVITCIRDAAGEVIGFSKVTRDLTERRAAENEIRKMNVDLEHRVKERTAELQAANEALKQRTKEAEEASRLKSQFVSNVSHELRTPLNAIIGYTYLIGDLCREAGGEQRTALEGIERNAGDLLQLINEVLDLSKIEAGKISVEQGEVEMAGLLKELVENMGRLTEGRPVRVDYKVAPDLPLIESDVGKIKQVLVNLLSNAIKFTPEGRVTMEAKASPAKGGIEVAVQDTGIGIKPEALPKIFEAFYQSDADSTREFGGVGLGLRIVKDLVDLLQGEIRVESEYGKGSTFTLFLPYRLYYRV